jgi:O-antigen ligase
VIVLWVAVLGADRIDLLGGAGPFRLLPIHLATAMVIGSEWWRRLQAGRLPTITRAQAAFGALLLGMLVLVAASVVRSVDILISTNRAVLLAGTAVGLSLAVLGAADRPDLRSVLARGARAGLVLAAVFSVVQLFHFVGLAPDWVRVGPVQIALQSFSYGAFPRLSGAAGEMNGAGAALVLQSVLIALSDPPVKGRRGWIVVGAVQVLATLSRASVLAGVIVLALFPRVVRARVATRAAMVGALLLVALSSVAVLNAGRRDLTARTLAPLASRFDPAEPSAQSHAMLMRRGVEEATRSVPRALFGFGYGTSYRALADVMPGTKYGNFHSLYVQLWAESGIFALLLLGAILVGSLPRAGALTGMLCAMAVYNLFYEGLAQPALWFVVALVWLAPTLAVRAGAQRPWYLAA